MSDHPSSSSLLPDIGLPDQQGFSRIMHRATLAVAVIMGVPALALLSMVIYLLHTANRVEHAEQIVAEVHWLQETALDMETGLRGFGLTGDERFLEPFLDGRQKIDERLNTLGLLVADSPAQSAAFETLSKKAAAWNLFAQEALTHEYDREQASRDAAFKLRGKSLMDAIRASTTKMIDAETQVLKRRTVSLHRARIVLFTALAVFFVAGTPLALTWLRRLLQAASETYRTSLLSAEIRANELHVTLRSIGDAVVATDAEGKVAFLNPAAERLMGWQSAEANGRPLAEVFDIFNESTGEPAENPVARVLRERIVVGLANHTVLRSRDGHETPIEDSAAPILDEAGAMHGVILVFHDVAGKRKAEEALRESEQRFRFLHELGEITRKLSNPGQIMTTVARLLGEHLRVSRCAYADVANDSEHFAIRGDYTSECASTVGDYHLSLFGERAAAEMRSGGTLVIRNVDVELSSDSGADMFNSIAVKAIICCPLLKNGTLRAMMAVHQTSPRNWTSYEIALVQDVVERCWTTIERASAEAEIEERARLTTLRADIAASLAFGGTLDRSLQICCERLVEHLDAALVCVWTLNATEAVLQLRTGAGIFTELDGAHSRIPLGQLAIGRIAQDQKPHLADDGPLDLFLNDPEWASREGIKAFAGYPLVVEGRLLGVFAIFARQKFSDAVLIDLSLIADGISHCIERKRAETALQTSENLKGAILETALDGIVLMDHEGVIVDWNPAAERIFGASKDAIVGRLLGDVIVPEALRERHYNGLKRYVETREARILGRRYELPAIRANGAEFPCEVSIIHIPGTEPPLFAGHLRDISESKQAEAELRAATERAETSAHAVAESAERFRLLAEVVSLQVWTAGLDGKLDFTNQECIAYFGANSDQELLGNNWAQYVHADDLSNALSSWRHSLASGERYETEFRLKGSNGTFRWFLARAEAMRDSEGNLAKWFGTNTDIHALKTAQNDAERASRAKDAFLAALSHELRTPLTPVLMTAAALREDERLPVDVREQLRMMERNIALEARLIDDLLDLTRIARGKLHLRAQPCDAHSLIGFAVEIVRDDALAKKIALNREFSAVNSGIATDPARFQQVIWNLLRNAVKFTPRGGFISIRTRDIINRNGTNWLCIEVTDSGIGIDPAMLDEIFLPFEQGGLTGDHRFGGMGLGLSIARAIIDLHGGAITARSAGSNLGSTFVVELPGAGEPPHGVAEHLHADFGMARPSVISPQNVETKPALRLLLVEDHEPTLQVLSRLLARAGHSIITASCVNDALETASKNSFDLVISDLGLPDGTGTELMLQLRDTYGLTGIALSGYGMEEDIARSREAGFKLHLIKPVDFQHLKAAIREVMAGVQ